MGTVVGMGFADLIGRFRSKARIASQLTHKIKAPKGPWFLEVFDQPASGCCPGAAF
jgi:hypothetical protein